MDWAFSCCLNKLNLCNLTLKYWCVVYFQKRRHWTSNPESKAWTTLPLRYHTNSDQRPELTNWLDLASDRNSINGIKLMHEITVEAAFGLKNLHVYTNIYKLNQRFFIKAVLAEWNILDINYIAKPFYVCVMHFLRIFLAIAISLLFFLLLCLLSFFFFSLFSIVITFNIKTICNHVKTFIMYYM